MKELLWNKHFFLFLRNLLEILSNTVPGLPGFSSTFACPFGECTKEDLKNRDIGDEKGRWTEGRPRTHAINCAHHQRYQALVTMYGEAKASKLQSTCFNVTHQPLQLHPDVHRPYIEIWGLDPLHLFLLGLFSKLLTLDLDSDLSINYFSGIMQQLLQRLEYLFHDEMKAWRKENDLRFENPEYVVLKHHNVGQQ